MKTIPALNDLNQESFRPYPDSLFMIQIKTTGEGHSSVVNGVAASPLEMAAVLPGCPSNHHLAVYKFVGTRPFDELDDEEEAKAKTEADARLDAFAADPLNFDRQDGSEVAVYTDDQDGPIPYVVPKDDEEVA